MGATITPEPSRDLRLRLRGARLNYMSISSGEACALAAHVVREDRASLLITQFSADADIRIDGEDAIFIPGGSVFICNGWQSLSIKHKKCLVAMVVMIENELLDGFLKLSRKKFHVVRGPDDSATHMLFSYVNGLLHEGVPEAVSLLAEYQIAELAASALLRGYDSEGQGTLAAAKKARLQDIQDDIAQNFQRHDFRLSELAARHNVSNRYVQLLFQSQGTTVMDYLARRRLEFARRRLINPMLHKMSISDIAFEAGFNDLTTFNRLFRKHFGQAPSAMRRAAEAILQTEPRPPAGPARPLPSFQEHRRDERD